MPLASFGSILTFAEEIEIQDRAFYSKACGNPENTKTMPLMEQFIKEGKKNISIIQRTRRENVTEMILEPISGFIREPFYIEIRDGKNMSSNDVLAFMKTIEQRSFDYYTQASAKMKALPEVSNVLKLLAKKHTVRIQKIENL